MEEELRPLKTEDGTWKCPLCGFSALNQKTVEMHIHRSHREMKAQKTQRKALNLGKTSVLLNEREKVEIRDQTGWRFFLIHNYVSEMHDKKVRVVLENGEELIGVLKARDPYFVKMKVNDRWVVVNKGKILMIEEKKEE